MVQKFQFQESEHAITLGATFVTFHMESLHVPLSSWLSLIFS